MIAPILKDAPPPENCHHDPMKTSRELRQDVEYVRSARNGGVGYRF
jgi:hypothetical protein